jgi:SET domain-containing protein
VKTSARHGVGVFAVRRIRRGEEVAEYAGELVKLSELKQRESDYVYQTWKRVAGSKDDFWCVVGDPDNRDGACANDACCELCNNCVIVYRAGRCFLKALRDIEAGKEGCVDYGDKFWAEEGRPGRLCSH